MVATAPNASDCLTYLSFDSDGSDSTSNSYDATINGATQTTGVISNCYSLDGSNDNIVLDKLGFPSNVGDDWGFSWWFKTSSTSTDNMMINLDGTGGLFVQCRLTLVGETTGTLSFYCRDNNNTASGWHTTTSTYNDGDWHHVYFANDATNNKLLIYIDGVNFIDIAYTSTGNFDIGSSDIVFGSNEAGTSQFYDGLVDELSIFTSLSADNIEYLYNSGSPGNAQQYPFTAQSVGNLAKWCGVSASSISKINGKTIQ